MEIVHSLVVELVQIQVQVAALPKTEMKQIVNRLPHGKLHQSRTQEEHDKAQTVGVAQTNHQRLNAVQLARGETVGKVAQVTDSSKQETSDSAHKTNDDVKPGVHP